MTLIDVLRLLRKNILILLLCAALGLGLAAARTLTRPEVYSATAVGWVVAGDTQNLGNATFGDAVALQRAEPTRASRTPEPSANVRPRP